MISDFAGGCRRCGGNDPVLEVQTGGTLQQEGFSKNDLTVIQREHGCELCDMSH